MEVWRGDHGRRQARILYTGKRIRIEMWVNGQWEAIPTYSAIGAAVMSLSIMQTAQSTLDEQDAMARDYMEEAQ